LRAATCSTTTAACSALGPSPASVAARSSAASASSRATSSAAYSSRLSRSRSVCDGKWYVSEPSATPASAATRRLLTAPMPPAAIVRSVAWRIRARVSDEAGAGAPAGDGVGGAGIGEA